jgi:signal recognition particle subunit SRP54
VTKLDGDSRGGAALSVVEVTEKPIKYIGVSEKLEGLEVFHPDRMATRILGMGDVLSLVERAQEAINKEEAEALEQRLRKQQFSLDDFMKMQKQMKMLGGLDQILGMLPIPGITKEMREMVAHTGESQMKRVESIIMSMTPGERDQPDTIHKNRQKRIAKGCGMPEEEVSKFLAQFEQMKMIMQMMTGFTDSMKSGKMPSGMPGFGMPGKNKKKKGKGLGGMPDFPMGGFPGGGFPGGAGGFPGLGKMPKMPGGGFSGGKFPGGKFTK